MSAGRIRPAMSRFLREEGFYLPIVLFAVAASLWPFVASARDLDVAEGPPTMPPALLRNVLRTHIEGIQILRDRRNPKVLFPLWIRRTQITMTIAGLVVGLTMATMNLIYSRWPRASQSGPTPWTLWDCFKLAALWYVGRLALHAIFRVSAIPPAFGPGYWVAEIFSAVLLVGALLHIACTERNAPLSALGIHWRGLPGAIGTGALGLIVIYPFMVLIVAAAASWFPDAAIEDTVAALLGTQQQRTVVIASVAVIVFVPVAEEMFYRGMVQPLLQRWLGGWNGLMFTALFFAAAHVRAERNLYLLPPLFILGLGLGYTYNRSRSMAAPIALHVFYNGFVVLLILSHRQILTELRALLH